MERGIRSERVLIGIFLALIFTVPLLQLAVELRRGEKPQALDAFKQKPTASHLRAYERDLEDASEVAKRLRPWAQFVQFAWFGDGGEKVILGNDGWLFYGPGVQYARERGDSRKGSSSVTEALEAIVAFRDDLAARNIRLLVLPMPNKESIYPERLSRRFTSTRPLVAAETAALLSGLKQAGVEMIDLWSVFGRAKYTSDEKMPLYLAQDSHWSPAGCRVAANTIARHITNALRMPPGQVEYEFRSLTESRTGDIVRMLRVPSLDRRATRQKVQCEQVVRCDDHTVYRDDPASDVLVLGDSFLRIYETDDPGSAGFTAHLAKELKKPLASLVNDGGASTLVRQELSRRPALLTGKKLVIWEFVERDIRLGTEGWQRVPLPKP